MTPKVRVVIALLTFGALALAAAVVVLFRNRSLDDELLGTIGAFGGVAMIATGIYFAVSNGNGKHKEDHHD
jgi:hypothetical protein